MPTVGIVAGSFKPFHIGHWELIKKIALENDQVILLVSLSDRARKGEVVIEGSDMEAIWKNYLLELIPANVSVSFIRDESPVRKIYTLLGDAQDADGHEQYFVYGDPADIAKNFPEAAIKKYLSILSGNGRLFFRSIPRATTVNISGTEMREYLELGDKEKFCKYLPPTRNKEAIWQILRHKTKKLLIKKSGWGI